jgi:hypothetical protein
MLRSEGIAEPYFLRATLLRKAAATTSRAVEIVSSAVAGGRGEVGIRRVWVAVLVEADLAMVSFLVDVVGLSREQVVAMRDTPLAHDALRIVSPSPPAIRRAVPPQCAWSSLCR